MHDLPADTQRRQSGSTFRARKHGVVCLRDFGIVVRRLNVISHPCDPRHLHVDHPEVHSRVLQVLSQTGVIHVIVCCQPAFDLFQRDPGALQIRTHSAHRAGPTEVHQQPRISRTDNPEVGRLVADVDDGGARLSHAVMYATSLPEPRVNAFFWIAVLIDAVILLLLLFLGMTSSGGGNGGREMATIFGVVIPALVVGAGIVLHQKAESTNVRVIALLVVAAPGLLLAATRGRSALIDWQVRKNASGSGYFSGGDLAVAGQAVVQGNAAVLRQLGPGLAVNSIGTGGTSLMSLALEQGHIVRTAPAERSARLAVVQALLDLGADPEPGLAEATKVEDVAFLRLLLDAGAEPNHTNEGEPIIFEWLAVTPISHFTLLCDRGLDLNTVNRIGEPLLVAAGRADRWDLVELLLSRGADHSRRDRHGDRVIDVVDGRLASETTRTDEQKAAIIRVRKLIHS